VITYFLWEGFETVVLPRTVTRTWRITRAFYRGLWFLVWRRIAARMLDFRTSDTFLSVFGPLSLILLLCIYASSLIVGFALLQWGACPILHGMTGERSFGDYLYFSGVTFYTLGYGDLLPAGGLGRTIAVAEAGTGFGFLAITIGYLPVIYSAFSRREGGTTLLDARAGSPPTATEMVHRHMQSGALDELQTFLRDMEHWSSEILESHLSYPVLAYYRSQHDDQSWLSALTVVLDTCALIMTGLDGIPKWQAKMTFAMGRHALVDFCLVFNAPPAENYLSRLTPPDIEIMKQGLTDCGSGFLDTDTAIERLNNYRQQYEPFAVSLARVFLFTLPPFVPAVDTADAWQRTAWGKRRDTHF
jgi:hypothetical protein